MPPSANNTVKVASASFVFFRFLWASTMGSKLSSATTQSPLNSMKGSDLTLPHLSSSLR